MTAQHYEHPAFLSYLKPLLAEMPDGFFTYRILCHDDRSYFVLIEVEASQEGYAWYQAISREYEANRAAEPKAALAAVESKPVGESWFKRLFGKWFRL